MKYAFKIQEEKAHNYVKRVKMKPKSWTTPLHDPNIGCILAVNSIRQPDPFARQLLDEVGTVGTQGSEPLGVL